MTGYLGGGIHRPAALRYVVFRTTALPTIVNFEFDSKACLFIPAEQRVIFLMAG